MIDISFCNNLNIEKMQQGNVFSWQPCFKRLVFCSHMASLTTTGPTESAHGILRVDVKDSSDTCLSISELHSGWLDDWGTVWWLPDMSCTLSTVAWQLDEAAPGGRTGSLTFRLSSQTLSQLKRHKISPMIFPPLLLS